MGYSAEQALGALRLTLGHASTEADVDLALRAVPAAVAQLRGFSARSAGARAQISWTPGQTAGALA
jgi:cysteine desulfurase